MACSLTEFLTPRLSSQTPHNLSAFQVMTTVLPAHIQVLRNIWAGGGTYRLKCGHRSW